MKTLNETLVEMTQNIKENTIEWIYRAIDKTKELNKTLDEKIKAKLDEVYGKENSREKVYAYTNIKYQIITEEIDKNTYTIGTYYIQRGVNRTSNSVKVIEDVNKDFDKKIKSLENKILKLANKDNIKEISNVWVEIDGRLGVNVILDCNDTILINVIEAGGWNIQKFHFRGIAKRRKGV